MNRTTLLRAIVRHHRVRCGILEELVPGGATRFTYDTLYLARAGARELASTLPLRASSHGCSTLHPFFVGLLVGLPASRRDPTTKDDDFVALVAAGSSLPGAVEVMLDGR